ncbi:deoxycytidylate deaminase [Spiroplasma clarkii]|uniref:Deoxycytidylate deaminase n=1 Tax=Spiroplasma clarkii TaxID=2139 RepID=A0A2K8KKP7_9MOLU|nr:dCMP deaminase family protein [Spiroplasma clarkii]ATX70841.1 deoxycytidylate deaminase [Spiroplasma clarkii]
MTKRTNYIDWDTYFLAMVKLIAMRSKDPSTQVGAVIVNDLFQVVSTGYNGFPRGISDDEFPWTREGDWTQTKYPYVVHAELNAILSSNTNVRDCTMYTSLFPCNECSKSIIQSGIKKIVYSCDKYSDTAEFQVSKKMLTTAGVQLELKPAVEVVLKFNK